MPGPFYFVWIDAPEAFNPDYHAVEDELVLSATVNHDEGDFPSCSILIENPRVGLLSRPVWAWLSWDKNWVPAQDHTPDIVPLFLGRLLGIPNTINKETVTLELIARPQTYAAQREAIADALRVEPYWDPLWVSSDKWTDPDTVLEAYSRLWHFDRITHEVTTSELLVGEDGVEEFQENEMPYDSIELSLGQVPFRKVSVQGTVKWDQKFGAAGNAITLVNDTIRTFTGGSLISDWPEPGDDLGGGYIVADAYARDLWRTEDSLMVTSSTSWSNPNEKHNPGDTMSTSQTISAPLAAPDSWISGLLTRQTEAGIGKASVNSTTIYIMEWQVRCHLSVTPGTNRGRTETAAFIMEANIQPILTDESDLEVKEIKVSSNRVDEATLDEELPIGDLARASFFETDRGQRSLRYLMCLARANLINAARCVEVTAMIKFDRAIELSCRKNAIIHDNRLPGGQALGKVKSYSFTCDGNTGEMSGRVTIGCAIGYGQSIVEQPGEPTYVEEGYVELGYQFYDGQTIVLPDGDVAYELPPFAGEDDGLRWPLTKQQIMVKGEWVGTRDQQVTAINAALPVEQVLANYGQVVTFEQLDEQRKIAKNNLENTMKDNSIWFDLELKNLEGKFTNAYNVTIIPLEIPAQIDLEFDAS